MTPLEKQIFVAAIAGATALAVLAEIFKARCRPHLTHRRGAKLVTRQTAAKFAARAGDGPYVPPPGFRGLLFGGLWLPFHFGFTGLVWHGATGVGKTLTFWQFIRSVLDLVARPGSRARLCLYDPKREFGRLVLAALPAHIPVYRLNFLDKRSVWWDLAADFRTPAELLQLAAFLMPAASKSEVQPFFRDGGRGLLYGGLLGLSSAAPGAWTLWDVVVMMSSRARLKYFLSLTPEGRAAADLYLRARSGPDVLATIASHLDKLKIVAACWRHARTSFSVTRYLDEQAVLLMELVDSAAELQKPFYQLFSRKLSDELLLRAGWGSPTIIAYDELPSIGEIDLVPLTSKGRASMATVAVTVMSLPALEESLGGATKAKALLDNLHTQAFLKVDSDQAERCSKQIGDEEVEEITIGVTNPHGQGTQPRQETEQPKITPRRLVTPDELKTLPSPDYAAGTVTGYFRLKDVGTYRAEVNFREGFQPLTPNPQVPDYDPRPGAEMRLPEGFTPADLTRLSIPDTPKYRKIFNVV